ncbi:MAG TPA: hypothetical protein VMK12_17830 [Anaeromyxobacteraceae bacterium]|nr:hypothetical protein [Anaeromyxobacteraceae bacterium]
MLKISVADVLVRYRTVEVPETCPECGSQLEEGKKSQSAVRELNLASANYYGAFRAEEGGAFHVDPASQEETPADALWVVYAYECSACGEVLATGALDVNGG